MDDLGESTRVQLLGGFELWCQGSLVVIGSPAARVVALTALADRMQRGDVVTRLWPDAPPGRGQAYLRSALWRLRVQAPSLIDSSDDGFLTTGAHVTVDAPTLRAWAIRVTRDQATTPAPDLAGLGRDLLPGWDDYWLDEYREQLRVLVPEALEAMASTLLTSEATAPALWYALTAHHIDPLRESAVRVLMRIYQEQGNHALARNAFDQYRHTLKAELGIGPSPDLTRLLQTRRPHPARR